MDIYKKLIRSRKLRFRILKFFRFVPDKLMIKIQYRIKCGRKLNLNAPKRYTEKLQWYKLYYRDPLMQQCADKYKVRQYIKEKGLEHILNDLFTTFSSPSEINLEGLPDQFALKLSNGSGTNYICKDKASCDLERLKELFIDYYAQSKTMAGREWVYNTDENPIIVAERYLEDPEKSDGSIRDYKILCFNGEPCYVVCDIDRFTDHRRNIYDIEWNNLGISSDCPCIEQEIQRPDNLPEMLDIARTLSSNFPAVRVDLYSIEGKIYFGELTFFPWSGYVQYTPDSFDYELGEKFVLPE